MSRKHHALAISAFTVLLLSQLVSNGFDLVSYLTDGAVSIPMQYYGLASLLSIVALIYLMIKPEKKRGRKR